MIDGTGQRVLAEGDDALVALGVLSLVDGEGELALADQVVEPALLRRDRPAASWA